MSPGPVTAQQDKSALQSPGEQMQPHLLGRGGRCVSESQVATAQQCTHFQKLYFDGMALAPLSAYGSLGIHNGYHVACAFVSVVD